MYVFVHIHMCIIQLGGEILVPQACMCVCARHIGMIEINMTHKHTERSDESLHLCVSACVHMHICIIKVNTAYNNTCRKVESLREYMYVCSRVYVCTHTKGRW
jgi:hypothetical protein